ncbi:MAG: hypothetical protein WD035_07465 [Balneolaceae bacterium]
MSKNFNDEELHVILSAIREELEKMHDFGHQLQEFDKMTLCLFIMLILDHNSYHPAIEIMKCMEASAVLTDLSNNMDP